MLNHERNDLHYDNNDNKDSKFTLDGSCQTASLFLWTTNLAARDVVLRMPAFSVGQAFNARWSSYLCRSCRARHADGGCQ
jgi:hypothetical protein